MAVEVKAAISFKKISISAEQGNLSTNLSFYRRIQASYRRIEKNLK
ncbi:hypothetical protein V7161_11690 [Neobacillus drentensis]